MNRAPVLTIDGPSGSGKGTVSRRVADRLGWHLLDSGALYRLVALSGRLDGLDPEDQPGHALAAAQLVVRFGQDSAGEERILLGPAQRDVTRADEVPEGATAHDRAAPPARDAASRPVRERAG